MCNFAREFLKRDETEQYHQLDLRNEKVFIDYDARSQHIGHSCY